MRSNKIQEAPGTKNLLSLQSKKKSEVKMSLLIKANIM